MWKLLPAVVKIALWLLQCALVIVMVAWVMLVKTVSAQQQQTVAAQATMVVVFGAILATALTNVIECVEKEIKEQS